MWGYLQTIAHRATGVLASRKFFKFILAIVVLQALWYSFNFVPWVNDETQHFRLTNIYTQQATPFIAEQPESWDKAGAVTRNGSYLFYYVMSWPLRGLQAVSDDTQWQLLVLRLIMIVVFVAGLILYRQALGRIKSLSPALVNGAMLVFVLVPAAGLLAGMYNYDVVIFALFGWLLYLAIQSIQAKQVLAMNLLAIGLISGVTILIKWAAVALVLPLILYLAYDQAIRFKSSFFKRFWQQFSRLKLVTRVAMIAGLLLVAGLVAERPIQNFVSYGKINPSCELVLNHDRCMKSGTYSSYQKTLSLKSPDFSPLPLPGYLVRYWIPRMADSATNLFERGLETRLPLAFVMFVVLAGLSMLVVLVRIGSIWKVKEFRLLVVVGVVYTAVLIVKQYLIYTDYAIPGAVRARYLVVLLPVYFTVVAYAIRPLISRFKTQSLLLGCLAIGLLISQGGGIVSHLVTAPRQAYVSDQAYKNNQRLKQLISPVVVKPKP